MPGKRGGQSLSFDPLAGWNVLRSDAASGVKASSFMGGGRGVGGVTLSDTSRLARINAEGDTPHNGRQAAPLDERVYLRS